MLLPLLLGCVHAYTPYNPSAGWGYFIEAVRDEAWPNCAYRFMSYPSSCDHIDLWNGAGGNELFTFIQPTKNTSSSSSKNGSFPDFASGDTFFLQLSCGRYVSYPGDCSQHTVDTWPEAGINQEFQLIRGDNTAFEWYIMAVGRSACDFKYLSFPGPCTTGGPDVLDLWNGAGVNQRFRIHAAFSRQTYTHAANSDGQCADPFAWAGSDGKTHLVCTGGNLPLYQSGNMSATMVFNGQGQALSGSFPGWLQADGRWAPENIEANGANFLFVCDSQSDGIHRVGWAVAGSANPGAWNRFSSNFLDLGNSKGGEIDAHVFRDPDTQQTYLLWKTDDNNAGEPVTHLWAQEVGFSTDSVTLKGNRQMIMDSTGLWWVNSWVAGGSLVEGPEMVKLNGWYYLFFAAGQYCQDSYTEGVARSKSVFGPFEKLGVPLLSTGLVGHFGGQKLVGPGHASFVMQGGKLWAVWHASPGENCNRQPFVDEVVFGDDGWPFVDFTASLGPKAVL